MPFDLHSFAALRREMEIGRDAWVKVKRSRFGMKHFGSSLVQPIQLRAIQITSGRLINSIGGVFSFAQSEAENIHFGSYEIRFDMLAS